MISWPLAQLYALTAAALLLFDGLWIGAVAGDLYRRQLGPVMRTDLQWGPAVAFYALYVVGVLVLAVLPGLQASSPLRAVALGALLGAVAYGTYGLTASAIIQEFSLRLALLDVAWGTLLTALVGGIAYAAGVWLGVG